MAKKSSCKIIIVAAVVQIDVDGEALDASIVAADEEVPTVRSPRAPRTLRGLGLPNCNEEVGDG